MSQIYRYDALTDQVTFLTMLDIKPIRVIGRKDLICVSDKTYISCYRLDTGETTKWANSELLVDAKGNPDYYILTVTGTQVKLYDVAGTLVASYDTGKTVNYASIRTGKKLIVAYTGAVELIDLSTTPATVTSLSVYTWANYVHTDCAPDGWCAVSCDPGKRPDGYIGAVIHTVDPSDTLYTLDYRGHFSMKFYGKPLINGSVTRNHEQNNYATAVGWYTYTSGITEVSVLGGSYNYFNYTGSTPNSGVGNIDYATFIVRKTDDSLANFKLSYQSRFAYGTEYDNNTKILYLILGYDNKLHAVRIDRETATVISDKVLATFTTTPEIFKPVVILLAQYTL